MRHRKVVNLYDTDQGHEDLLVYLEGIEGPTRQQQALLQMVMVGFRVIAFHESGDEAYYGVRNPDVRSARKSATPRLPGKPKREPPVIEAQVEKVVQPKVSDVSADQRQLEEHKLPAVEQASQHGYQEQTSQEDEYNTLKILRMMDEGDD